MLPERNGIFKRITSEIFYEVPKVIKSKTTSHIRNVFSYVDGGRYVFASVFKWL